MLLNLCLILLHTTLLRWLASLFALTLRCRRRQNCVPAAAAAAAAIICCKHCACYGSGALCSLVCCIGEGAHLVQGGIGREVGRLRRAPFVVEQAEGNPLRDPGGVQ